MFYSHCWETVDEETKRCEKCGQSNHLYEDGWDNDYDGCRMSPEEMSRRYEGLIAEINSFEYEIE
ncbi:hypothetical protein [Bacillus sp. Marseille-P3800]|uniref:hypothetical protein n=1 Tax=Bacillus sp. Marseille-P3800 TaxID=2014782 RepID=UPI000C0840F3|nr:hypothetical protein [Bacillus sp. Marseille-P3800]